MSEWHFVLRLLFCCFGFGRSSTIAGVERRPLSATVSCSRLTRGLEEEEEEEYNAYSATVSCSRLTRGLEREECNAWIA